MVAMVIPLGIRNRNPGNIRPSNPAWQGAVGVNGGFVVFDSMTNGIRALCKQLIVYQTRYGIKTVRDAISRWAPPTDHNDTEAYIVMVCTILDCDDEDTFDFHDKDFLYWMVCAIGEQENGHAAFGQYVFDVDIDEGIRRAQE